MIKIVKYLLLLLIVALFGAVVIGQSMFLDRINIKIRSSGILSSILMSDSGSSNSSGDLLQELGKTNKLSKPGEESDKDDYRNPALEYEGVDTSSLKNRGAGLISMNSRENIMKNLQRPDKDGGGGSAESKTMGGDPRDILSKRYGSEGSIDQQDKEEEKPLKKADYSGYYQLQITTKGNSMYSLYVQIDELDGSILKIRGNHAYTEFSYTAIPTDVTTQTGSWRVSANTGSMIKSIADINITERDGYCELEGDVITSYNALLIKGKKTATITGIKVAETKQAETEPSMIDEYNEKVAFLAPDNEFNKPSPLKSGSATAVAGLAVAITGIAASRTKRNIIESKQNKGKIKDIPVRPSKAQIEDENATGNND